MVNFDFPIYISYNNNYSKKKDGVKVTQFNRLDNAITNCEQLLVCVNDSVVDGFLYKDNRRRDANIGGASLLCYDIDITKEMSCRQREIYVKRLIISLLLHNYNFVLAPSFNKGLHLYIPIKEHTKLESIEVKRYKQAIRFTKHKIAEIVGIDNDYDKQNTSMLVGAKIQYDIKNSDKLYDVDTGNIEYKNLFSYQKQTKDLLDISDYVDSYLLLLEKDLLNAMYITDAKTKGIHYLWIKDSWHFENVNEKTYRKKISAMREDYNKLNDKKITYNDFELGRCAIAKDNTFWYDTDNNIVHILDCYFANSESEIVDDSKRIDNGISMINRCSQEWLDFFDMYIRRVVCGDSVLVFRDFIHCLLTLYLNPSANFVSIFYGQGGPGKSFMTKLIGYIIEGKSSLESRFGERFNAHFEVGRCHEIAEFRDWKRYIEIIKDWARAFLLNIEGKGKDIKRILNDKIIMITTNNLKPNNTQERFIRQYLFSNIEGWGDDEGILATKIKEVGEEIVASEFLNYVFTFFDFDADYMRINRMGDALLEEVSKNYDISVKIEKIYDEYFKSDYTYYLPARRLIGILVKENIIENCNQLKQSHKVLLTGYGFNLMKGKATNKSSSNYRLDPIEEDN